MDQESGAVSGRAGDYLVAFVQEEAGGMWGPNSDGRLVWHESREEANAHLEVAVADAGDGRFVPGLAVTLTVSTEDGELFSTKCAHAPPLDRTRTEGEVDMQVDDLLVEAVRGNFHGGVVIRGELDIATVPLCRTCWTVSWSGGPGGSSSIYPA